jgi:hypothetical protein
MTNEESKQLTQVANQVVSLKEYFDKQLELYKESLNTKVESVVNSAIMRHEFLAEAVKVKAETLEKRFDNTNEWRNTVIDILAKAATKEDLKVVYTKLEELEEFKNSTQELPGNIKALQTGISEIKEWKNKQEGKASQSSVIWAYIISAASFILTLITLLEKFTK